MDKEIVLKCSPLRFYTLIDEDGCFDWIKKIEPIIKYEGIGRELHLTLKSSIIPDKELLELMGLFRRYNFDSEQLKIFINENNKDFFPRVDGVGTESFYKFYPRREKEKLIRGEINLKCTPLKFYTKNDANAMFMLIEKVKSVTKCYGIGQVLYIVVDSKKASEKDIANLNALLVRYKFNQKQLDKLKKLVNKL